jgi:hypothetical protein
MVKTALPDDVALLSWLAGQLGIAESTTYRLAATGGLADFGVFLVGHQYRVSKPKALRKIHGATPETTRPPS